MARVNLMGAIDRMKKWEYTYKRDAKFGVGDMVFVKMNMKQFPPPTRMSRLLVRRF